MKNYSCKMQFLNFDFALLFNNLIRIVQDLQ